MEREISPQQQRLRTNDVFLRGDDKSIDHPPDAKPLATQPKHHGSEIHLCTESHEKSGVTCWIDSDWRVVLITARALRSFGWPIHRKPNGKSGFDFLASR